MIIACFSAPASRSYTHLLGNSPEKNIPFQASNGKAGREAVHSLARINQTILTLIEGLTADIAERAAA